MIPGCCVRLALLALAVCIGVAPAPARGCDPRDRVITHASSQPGEVVAGSARLEVTARDVTGRPVKALVIVDRLTAQGPARAAEGRTAAGQGTFFLPPGAYRITVVPPAGEARAFELDLAGSQTRVLKVVFE